MPLRRFLWSITGPVLGLLIVAFAWNLRLENRSLRQQVTELKAEAVRPYLFNGFKMDVLTKTETIRSWDVTDKAQTPSRRLLLALEDQCQFSAEAMKGWTKLIRTTAGSPSYDLWVFTFGGESLAFELMQSAKQAGIGGRVLRVLDETQFALRSGIGAVPLTILLDSQSAIELVADGALGEREVRIFEDHILSGTVETGQARFLKSEVATGVTSVLHRLPNRAPPSGSLDQLD